MIDQAQSQPASQPIGQPQTIQATLTLTPVGNGPLCSDGSCHNANCPMCNLLEFKARMATMGFQPQVEVHTVSVT